MAIKCTNSDQLKDGMVYCKISSSHLKKKEYCNKVVWLLYFTSVWADIILLLHHNLGMIDDLGIIHNLLLGWGYLLGRHRFFTKTIVWQIFFDKTIFGDGVHIVTKLFMIFWYINFLKGLKMMFKPWLTHYNDLSNFIHSGNGALMFHQNYFTMWFWKIKKSFRRHPFFDSPKSKSPPLVVIYEWYLRSRIGHVIKESPTHYCTNIHCSI